MVDGIPVGCTIFSTGTDEHGTKIQQAAREAQLQPAEYCRNISAEYMETFRRCDIGYTDFVRTSKQKHIEVVQQFWKTLVNNGHISPGHYRGWYCTADESFLTENQLKTVKTNGESMTVSIESGRPVHWVEEENFKFNLPAFESDVVRWIESGDVIKPKHFQKLLLSWINDGLMSQEVSVSRPSHRVHWGIPVPDNADQTVYVWLDALASYLTVAGYPKLKKWPPDVQFIGKDILKFHGIYWPAFLMAAGLEPPGSMVVHSHWTVDGEKMSKSRGNVVCPIESEHNYTSSGLRYFLLREATLPNDSNYSETKIIRVLNSELADTLGNLLNRCCGKTINKMQIFPRFVREDFDKYCKQSAADLISSLESLSDEVRSHYSEFNFYRGIAAVISALHEANKFFEFSKPWELRRNEDSRNHLHCVLHLAMESLRICGIALLPVVPRLSDELLGKLSVPNKSRTWADMEPSWKRVEDQDVPLLCDDILLYRRLVTVSN
ncbi:hypothetical protein AAG570_009940 [Ranatra chinensis]|uniref:Methionine--tRNA ligase, mitochondrial n=1 Tax=Ranatra chinensis TaxID=642074 RepID=A0ABD0YQP4_9HEMI